MGENLWAGLYEEAGTPQLNPVLVGFNINLDRIIPVSGELLGSPGFRHGDLNELRLHLIHSMEHCTAEEWFVPDPVQYAGYTEYFGNTGSLSMGGQAGIAALHLASLDSSQVICIAPAMGRETRQRLVNGGVEVPGDYGESTSPDAVHLVFEYKPGLVPLADGALARDNRFIASPKKTAETTILPKKSLAEVLPRITACTRAFLSGFQYLGDEKEFDRAADQIRAFKEKNPDLRVHIECVSVTDVQVITGIVRHILPVADSAGMNEHELSLMLNYSNTPRQDSRNQDLVSPGDMARGMLELAKKTGLVRIHLHTFGYYLLVIQKNRVVPEDSRAALLYAARVVAAAAGGTGSRISVAGLEAVEQIAKVFGKEMSPGIFLHEGYYVIIVPTIIAKNIRKTAGLGDILSSTALVADRF